MWQRQWILKHTEILFINMCVLKYSNVNVATERLSKKCVLQCGNDNVAMCILLSNKCVLQCGNDKVAMCVLLSK
jgi:hypothetical protein